MSQVVREDCSVGVPSKRKEKEELVPGPRGRGQKAQPGWARSVALQVSIVAKPALGALGKGNQNFQILGLTEVGGLGGGGSGGSWISLKPQGPLAQKLHEACFWCTRIFERP